MGNEMVTVMATARGYYGDRVREEGDTFEVPRDALTAKRQNDKEGKIDPNGKIVKPTWFEPAVEQVVETKKTVLKSELDKKDASDLA